MLPEPLSSMEPAVPQPVRPDRRIGKRIIAFGCLMLIVLAATFVGVSNIRARETIALQQEASEKISALPAVDTVKATAAPGSQKLMLPGEVSAWYRTTIYSRVNGYLAKWCVDIGDRVQKGQVLAVIDTPDLDSQLDAAKAELNAAEAEVKVRQSEADFANTSYDRWRESPKGVVSEQEREAKKAAYESAVAQLNAAKARVNVDRAKVDGLVSLTTFKNVQAPFDGTITERRIDPGDLVTAGSTANTTPLFVIEQSDRIRIFTDVPQDAARYLAGGAPVRVITGTREQQALNGKISRTTGSLDRSARTLRAEIDLANKDYALVPGMYVRVELQLGGAAGIRVPASALLFRTNDPEVAVVGRDQKVQLRKVVISRDDGNAVELASGVQAGELVALNIAGHIADGTKVAVNSTTEITY